MPTETKTNDDNDCGLLLERHCCFWTTASVTSVWRKHVFVAIRQRQAEKNIRLYSKIHNILFANEQREAKRGHMHIICVMRFYYYYFLWLSINFGSMCAMCVGTEFMVMTWDRSDEKLCDRLRAAVRWHEYHFFFLLFIQWTWKKVFFYSIQKVVGWSLFNFFFVCLFATIEFDMRKWMKFFCGLFVTGERWVRTHFHIYTLHTQTWMQPSCMDDKSGWDAALCLHFIKSTRIFHFTYISFPIRASRPDTPAQLYIYNFIQKYLIVNWWRRKKTNKTNEDGPKSSFCKVFEVSNLLRINWKTEFFMWHILWWWIGTEIEAWGRTHTQTYAWQLKGGNST